MTVGENIKRIRKEKGLTQKRLGELCGINEAQIRRYELGGKNSNPKLETLEKIASALSVEVYDLIPDTKIKVQKINEDGSISDKYVGWVELWKQVDQEKKKIKLFTDNAPNDSYKKLLNSFNCLNNTGQDKAIEQVEILTKISEYLKDPE